MLENSQVSFMRYVPDEASSFSLLSVRFDHHAEEAAPIRVEVCYRVDLPEVAGNTGAITPVFFNLLSCTRVDTRERVRLPMATMRHVQRLAQAQTTERLNS